jgi:hypothetical protein
MLCGLLQPVFLPFPVVPWLRVYLVLDVLH